MTSAKHRFRQASTTSSTSGDKQLRYAYLLSGFVFITARLTHRYCCVCSTGLTYSRPEQTQTSLPGSKETLIFFKKLTTAWQTSRDFKSNKISPPEVVRMRS